MVYCELCETTYSEVEYKNHLMKCIEETNPYTKRGFDNYKAAQIFQILQEVYGYKGIISYLNKPPIVSGGPVRFLFFAAPNLITDAYIQAVESDDQNIAKIALSSIEFAFLSLLSFEYDLDDEDARIIVFISKLIDNERIKEIISSRFKTLEEYRRQNFLDTISQLKYYGESRIKTTVNYHKKKLVEFLLNL